MSYEPRRASWQEDVDIRGLRHRLTWWGERTNTPVVLLHGFLDCGATWQFLVDRLPPSWTLVAPDWRGFGDSEWAPGGYWFPDYFPDLDVLLDTLVPQSRARVIGHSMGANVAKMYGGIRPQRLQWLVNLEGLGLARTRAEEAPKRYAAYSSDREHVFHAMVNSAWRGQLETGFLRQVFTIRQGSAPAQRVWAGFSGFGFPSIGCERRAV